jgi:glutathione S-transferase
MERRLAWSAVVEGYTDETLSAVKHRLEFPLKRLETSLSSGPWLAGSAYSVADIEAFSLVNALPGLAPELVNEQTTPRLTDFIDRMRARPAVRQALELSRTGKPLEAFVPGSEPSRWG